MKPPNTKENAKVATYEITKVRTERPVGAAHEHIAGVELEGRSDWRYTRDWVIAQIKSVNGHRFYTWGGGLKADVVVRGCPFCTFGRYITTLPDSTTKNNLLDLPRYH